jgi:hypothetical protein
MISRVEGRFNGLATPATRAVRPSRAPRVRPWSACRRQVGLALAACAAAVAGAAVLRLAYGPGYVGYDASWTLVWASQLTDGRLPTYEEHGAPTPHPLAIVIALPMTVFGDGGEAMVAVGFVSLAVLLAGLVALGAALSWWPAGVVAAAIVATRGSVIDATVFASIDVPFMACVVWAAALEARQPRRGLPVLGLLLAAGLLRPEAWLLSAAYVIWLAVAAPPARLLLAAALAGAGPIVWGLSDLAVTGDALHSFRHTQDLAGELERPTGMGSALSGLPDALRRAVGDLPLLAGLLGAAAGLAVAPRRVWLPSTVVAGSVLGWFVLGAAGLPLLTRYLLVAACMIAALAGIGAALPRMATGRKMGYAAAAGVVALLVASVPATIEDVAATGRSAAARERAHHDLRRLTDAPALQAAARRCGRIVAPDIRARPLLVLDLGVEWRQVTVDSGPPGLVVTYASHEAAHVFRFRGQRQVRQRIPTDAVVVARNRSWLAYAVCAGPETG